MSRRSALPGAAELFRSTGGSADRAVPTDEPGSAAGPSGSRPSSHVVSSGAAPEVPTRAERLLAEPQGVPAETGDPEGATGRDDGRTRGRSGAARPEDDAGSVSAVGRRRAAASPATGGRVPTGRERHDEKITVYVSVAELMDLERARLTLRGEHGLAVDRGRIVREALAVVLADLAAEGESSTLVRRLRSR